MRPPPPAIRSAIEDELHRCRFQRKFSIDVYDLAERIRIAHVEENVALEDILELIISLAGTDFSIEFNQKSQERTLMATASNDDEMFPGQMLVPPAKMMLRQ